MDVRHGYNGEIFTSVGFFDCEALQKDALLRGCEAEGRVFEIAADDFAGTVTVFGRDVTVADIIAVGLQALRESRTVPISPSTN